MTGTHNKPALSEKDGEIIAVGASIASGCLPCTKFHMRAASLAGAKEAEIQQAVRDATRVRRTATEIMAGAGGVPLAGTDQSTPDPLPRSLIRELVSASAAYAINCTTSLEAHLEAARALGATDRQMFAVLEIACGIRDVATSKAKTTAGRFLGVREDQAAGCECDDNDGRPAKGASSRTPDARRGADGEPCSCQGDTTAQVKRLRSKPKERRQ